MSHHTSCSTTSQQNQASGLYYGWGTGASGHENIGVRDHADTRWQGPDEVHGYRGVHRDAVDRLCVGRIVFVVYM